MRLRIEQARADAEREARMRVEATEAAERARLAAALEQERLRQSSSCGAPRCEEAADVDGRGDGGRAGGRRGIRGVRGRSHARGRGRADREGARRCRDRQRPEEDAAEAGRDSSTRCSATSTTSQGKVAEAQHALVVAARPRPEREQAQARCDAGEPQAKAIADAIQKAQDLEQGARSTASGRSTVDAVLHRQRRFARSTDHDRGTMRWVLSRSSRRPCCRLRATAIIIRTAPSTVPAITCTPACGDPTGLSLRHVRAAADAVHRRTLDCPGDAVLRYVERASACRGASGPAAASDPTCKRDPVPGVFFPGAQCEWLAPAGRRSVSRTTSTCSRRRWSRRSTSTGEFSAPSIVFTSYNFTDGGAQSCESSDPTNYYGVIRVIDGRTCKQQATIAIADASSRRRRVAIADIGGGDATPEIVGGAQRRRPRRVHAEADRLGGAVADARRRSATRSATGPARRSTTSTTTASPRSCSTATSTTAQRQRARRVARRDRRRDRRRLHPGRRGRRRRRHDRAGHRHELYGWDKTAQNGMPKTTLPGAQRPHSRSPTSARSRRTAPDDRSTLDGIAEVALIAPRRRARLHRRRPRGVHREPAGRDAAARGGPPTIADFDGDGRVEFASAGATAYDVFDPDCRGTPDPATCPSMTTNGVAVVRSRRRTARRTSTGSSVFDFDGDGRAEVVYGDECFTRVYDGITGKVLYSRYRTSCTWYENPVIADVDADFNAEIVSTSNTNCNVACPAVDPIFDGVQCLDDSDCPRDHACGRERRGRSRSAAAAARRTLTAAATASCASIRSPDRRPRARSAAHRTRPAPPRPACACSPTRVDRWVNTRTIWNQHAYSVTNIDDDRQGAAHEPVAAELEADGPQQLPPELARRGRDRGRDSRSHGQAGEGHVRRGRRRRSRPRSATAAPSRSRRGVPVAIYDNADPPMAALHRRRPIERIDPGFCASGVVHVDRRQRRRASSSSMTAATVPASTSSAARTTTRSRST